MFGCRTLHIVLAVSVAMALVVPAHGSQAVNRINGVSLSRQGPATVVEIASERAPNFTTFKQDDPRRVIVDVAECGLNGVPERIAGDGSLVGAITTSQFGRAPHGISRIVIQLLREAEYRVTISGGSLFVHLSEGAGGLLVSAGVPMAPPAPEATVGSPPVSQPAKAYDGPRVAEHAQPVKVAYADPGSEPQDDLPAPVPGAATGGPSPADREPDLVLKPPPEPYDGPRAAEHSQPVKVAYADPGSEPRDDPPSPEAKAGGPSGEDRQPDLVIETPATPEPSSGDAVLVAQDEYEEVDEVEEVEEVEEVPVEVIEEVEEVPADPYADQPSEEEVPLPPPPEESYPAPVPDDEVEETPAATDPYETPVEDVPPPPPPADTYSEERVEISSALKDMTWVGFQQTRESSRVFVKTNEPVTYRLAEEGEKLIVLELENTRIPTRNNQRFLDTHFFDSAVTLVTPREIEGVTRSVRIEIQLKNRVPYRAVQEENMVYVNFDRPQ